MPIVEIAAVQQEGLDVPEVLAKLCRELAVALGEPEDGMWATWRPLDHYVEGTRRATRQPFDTHPPLVRVTALEGRTPEAIRAMLECVGHVLERELRLEAGNVFVRYDEARRGALYTGGRVVE